MDPNEIPSSSTEDESIHRSEAPVKYGPIVPASLARRPSNPLNRSATKETIRDPNLDVNLPYRTLSGDANLSEYTTETVTGEIPGPVEPDGENRYKLVTFLPNDPENPKNWSKGYKWYCTMVVAATCFVVAFSSSVVTPDIVGVADEFGVSEEVALLSITLFVVGFGVGKRIHSTQFK